MGKNRKSNNDNGVSGGLARWIETKLQEFHIRDGESTWRAVHRNYPSCSEDEMEDLYAKSLKSVIELVFRCPGKMPDNLAAYVKTCMKHELSARVKRSKRLEALDSIPEPIAEGTAELFELAILSPVIQSAVEQLDEGQQAVVKLIYYEGMSLRTTADRLQITLAIVRKRQIQALAAIRNHLES